MKTEDLVSAFNEVDAMYLIETEKIRCLNERGHRIRVMLVSVAAAAVIFVILWILVKGNITQKNNVSESVPTSALFEKVETTPAGTEEDISGAVSIPDFYGLKHEEIPEEAAEYLSGMEEQIKRSIVDFGISEAYLQKEKKVYLLAPFCIYHEEEGAYIPMNRSSLLFPVASNNTIIGILQLTEAGNEWTYALTAQYAGLVQEMCIDNADRILIFHEDEQTPITLWLPETAPVHTSEDNIYKVLENLHEYNRNN